MLAEFIEQLHVFSLNFELFTFGDAVYIGQAKTLPPASLANSPVFLIDNDNLLLEGFLSLMDNFTTCLKLGTNIPRNNNHPMI